MHQEQVQVSVIIPCLNVAPYLADAVRSALEQASVSLEIICVDNGSTDGTRKQIAQWVQTHPGIVMAVDEHVKNASVARNTGLALACGQYIQFLDADDWLLPGKIARQLALLESNPSLDFVCGAATYQLTNGTRGHLPVWDDLWLGLAHGQRYGINSSILWRRPILDKIGGWSAQLQHAQDTELLLKALMANAQYAIDTAPSALYRMRPEGQITNSNPAQAERSHAAVRHTMHQYLESQRPAYWQQHAPFFRHGLYKFLRRLAAYSPNEAAALFADYLPQGFKLQAIPALGIPRREIRLVNAVGFGVFVKSLYVLKRLVPSGVRGSLKKLFLR